MSPRGCTALVLALLACAGCGSGTYNLYRFEARFLVEDVVDLMTIVFQTGENAFVGDAVEEEDLVGAPGAGNGYRATYDLPKAFRVGLDFGAGRASVRVTEDGVPVADPLGFSFGTSGALLVELEYELLYEGRAASGRRTDFALQATLTATRATAAVPFEVEYFIDGHCEIGATFCDVATRFRAPGRPRDGLVPGFGDAEGFIDDPDVYEIYDLDLDYGLDRFRAQGDVGCCAYFDEYFSYASVF